MNPPSYLQVTYRQGKLQAAYLYLPRRPGDVSVKTLATGRGVVVDFTANGRAIGVELLSPATTTLEEVNETLRQANQPTIRSEHLAPLLAA